MKAIREKDTTWPIMRLPYLSARGPLKLRTRSKMILETMRRSRTFLLLLRILVCVAGAILHQLHPFWPHTESQMWDWLIHSIHIKLIYPKDERTLISMTAWFTDTCLIPISILKMLYIVISIDFQNCKNYFKVLMGFCMQWSALFFFTLVQLAHLSQTFFHLC